MFKKKSILALLIFISSKAFSQEAEEIIFYGKNNPKTKTINKERKRSVNQENEPSIKVEIKGHNINPTNQKDAENRSIFTVEPDATFSIKVNINSFSKIDLKNVEIENYDDFSFQRSASSNSFSSINGEESWQQSKEFSFVSPAENGNYILGPFNIETSEESLQKEAMVIQVKELSYEQASSRPCYAILETENDNPFIMQEFKIRLKIFSKENEIFQPEPQIINLPNFEKKDLGKEETKEVINGKSYKVETYHYTATPTKTGKLEIPPIGISYVSKQIIDSPFWGRMEVPKEGFIRSNRLHLNVLEIPENQKDVDAVGSFSSIKMETNKNIANSNEPIILKLTLEGSGNLDQISHPKLKLNKKIKHYKSKESVNSLKTQKAFEYILQIPLAGSYKIPKQEFTFFNPENKKYETIFSNSIEIELENSESVASVNSNSNNKPLDKNNNSKTEDFNSKNNNFDDFFIQNNNSLFSYIPKKMPETIFYLFVFLILFSNLIILLKEKIYFWFRKKHIAKTTIKKLKQIKHKSEYHKALEAFNFFLKIKFEINDPHLSDKKIIWIIKNLKFDTNQINDFEKTFQNVYRMTFANDNIEDEVKKETINNLILWIKKIDLKDHLAVGNKENA